MNLPRVWHLCQMFQNISKMILKEMKYLVHVLAYNQWRPLMTLGVYCLCLLLLWSMKTPQHRCPSCSLPLTAFPAQHDIWWVNRLSDSTDNCKSTDKQTHWQTHGGDWEHSLLESEPSQTWAEPQVWTCYSLDRGLAQRFKQNPSWALITMLAHLRLGSDFSGPSLSRD